MLHNTFRKMKNVVFIIISLFISLSCQRGEEQNIVPDNKDWYVLESPEAQPIQASYGDIDGTFIIATLFNIYLTDDRGKTWVKANYNPGTSHGLFGFTLVNDTLMVLDGKRIVNGDSVYYGIDPFYYSVDLGKNWLPFKGLKKINLPLNMLKTSSGITYTINEILTPKTNSTTEFYVETIGIKTSDARQLILPNRHQIKSISFDKKQRLYVSASSSMCGPPEMLKPCSGQKGVLYVSKQSQR